MIKIIDDFLNKITMYRLVLYYLIILIVAAASLGAFRLIPFSPVSIIASAIFLYFFSSFVNDILSMFFHAPANIESTYITALILALIVNPVKTPFDFIFLGTVAIVAISSKYVLAINQKHLFNPAAIAMVITSLFLNGSASWWIGNLPMLPLVFLGGLLIVRKIRKEKMVWSFLLSFLIVSLILAVLKGTNLFSQLDKILLHTALFFFAFVMLTEPLTIPPTVGLQIIYGIIVGFLYLPQIHIGSIYSTPELSLIIGNIFAYIVSPKDKFVLHLKEKLVIAKDTFDFIFLPNKKLSFLPGQYMEWTLPHDKSDDRGNRRYFTIASSPTEEELRIGVKFYQNSSNYKKKMLEMNQETVIAAGQTAGDFTLSEDKNKKYVFIAGGIGITPFRSIIKYLIDTQQQKDIILLYSNKAIDEIAYKGIFDEACYKLNLKAIYTLTDLSSIPPDWTGEKGRISAEMIVRNIPDYKERVFYISGPHSLITSFEETIKSLGIDSHKIKKDFFPGFV